MEGALERKPGVGTKVSKKRITTNLDNWLSFTQEMSQKDIPMDSFLSNSKLIKPPKEVAIALGIEDGRQIIMLERLRYWKTTCGLFRILYTSTY